MPAVISAELKERIQKAKDLISVAERELDVVLGELTNVERADKQMISTVLRKAFDKLEAAKKNLEEVVEEG